MKRYYLLLLLAFIFIVAACTTPGSAPRSVLGTPYPSVTPSPSLMPGYVQTAQNAQAVSEMTIAAGNAQMQQLSVQGTDAALNLVFAQQTQTAAIVATNDEATHVAQATNDEAQRRRETATQSVIETSAAGVATNNAINTEVAGAATQVGLNKIRTEAEIAAEQAYFFKWFWRVVVVAAVAFFFVIGWLLHKPVVFWVLARLGGVRRGRGGKTEIVIPTANGVVVADAESGNFITVSNDAEVVAGNGNAGRQTLGRKGTTVTEPAFDIIVPGNPGTIPPEIELDQLDVMNQAWEAVDSEVREVNE